jgi:hypothetical protein
MYIIKRYFILGGTSFFSIYEKKKLYNNTVPSHIFLLLLVSPHVQRNCAVSEHYFIMHIHFLLVIPNKHNTENIIKMLLSLYFSKPPAPYTAILFALQDKANMMHNFFSLSLSQNRIFDNALCLFFFLFRESIFLNTAQTIIHCVRCSSTSRSPFRILI